MRRPLLVLLLAVVLPGVVLAMLGFRTIREERRLVDSQIRDTLDRAANRAAGDLERELASWRQVASDAAAACGSGGEIPLTPRFQAASRAPGGAVLVCVGDSRARSAPPGALAWTIGPEAGAAVAAPLPAAYRETETLEIVREDYAAAASAYRALLGGASGERRAWLLHRLARTTAKMKKPEEALRLYRELLNAPLVVVSGLPSDLLARHAVCQLLSAEADPPVVAACGARLYASLADGTWRLDQSRYLYYAEAARQWAAASPDAPPELARSAQTDAGRRALTFAAEEALTRLTRDPAGTAASFTAKSGSAEYVCLVGAAYGGGPSPGTIAIVSAGRLASDALQGSLAGAEFEGVALALTGPDGSPWFGATPLDVEEPYGTISPSTRYVQAGESVWQIRAAVGGRLPIISQLERRRRISVFMLGLMALTLAFGVAVVALTTRRALDVARMKSQFVSAVSHEFRSPLTAIRQLTELLSRGRVPTEERRQEYYDTLLRESDRLSRLVDNVLDVSRMEDRRKQYRFESFDTGPWLRDAIDEFGRQAASLGKQVDASIPPGLPPISGDREALTRVVHNLLDNAAKYSPDQPTIWIGAARDDGALVIRVRDAGVGIPKREQARVFDRFFRGSTLEASVKGTGLGLAIVKHAVEAHGGRVTFECEEDRGTTFTVRLPLGGPQAG